MVDNEFDNRYPIFQELYHYEEKFLEFEKVLDSNEMDYKKYKVKVFKVDKLE